MGNWAKVGGNGLIFSLFMFICAKVGEVTLLPFLTKMDFELNPLLYFY